MDTSLYRTAIWVSVVSTIERSHCIYKEFPQSKYGEEFPQSKCGKVKKRYDRFCSLLCTCSEKHIRVCQVLGMRGDIRIIYGDKWGSIGAGYVCFCDMSYIVMQMLGMCT